MANDYTDEERKRAQAEFWQALGFAVLGSAQKGKELEALGRGGLAGMTAKNRSLEDSSQARIRKATADRMSVEQTMLERTLANQNAQQAAARKFLSPGFEGFQSEDRDGNLVDNPAQAPQQDWMGYARAISAIDPQAGAALEPYARKQGVAAVLRGAPPASPAAMAGASAGGAPAGPSATSGIPSKGDLVQMQVAQMMQQAQALRTAGYIEESDAMIQRAQTLLPKFDATPRYGVKDGKRIAYVLDGAGNMKELPVGPDQEKAVFSDSGDVITPRDPYTGIPVGAAIPKSQDPNSRASNAVAWYNATKPTVHDGQVITLGKGGATAQPIAGYQKPMDAATQRAVGDSRVQMGLIDRALAEVEANPSAFGPQNLVAKLPLGADVLQYADEGGNTARAAVGQVAAKKIHDLTGAAMTMGEAPRFNVFIPQPHDKPGVIKAKLTAMKVEEQLVQRELAAGRSLAEVATAPPQTKLSMPVEKSPLKGGPTGSPKEERGKWSATVISGG